MAKHTEKCTECGTRYNSLDNPDCPYCHFSIETKRRVVEDS
jgi:DNA-directed RNA polymerase subunit RPC12/RpoP